MERLTRKSKNSDMVWFVDRENNNIDLEPCEMNSHHNRLAIQKLAEYEHDEEQGLLLRLPCKVGDTVYWLTTHGVLERYVSSMDLIRINHIAIKLQPLGLDGEVYPFVTIVFSENFGETVFVTREEAEATLKKLNGEYNE